MKRIISIILVLVMMFSLGGCTSGKQTSDSQQSQITEELLKEANAQIGMPEIHNFFEKDTMKYLYELRDDPELITYTYIVNLEGKLVYQGQSIGFGIPASVQYSNPVKFTQGDHELGYDISGINYVMTKPQAEPNGLFMPEGLSATWIIMINEDTGELMPEYFEPTIVVKQQKAPRRLCAEWSLPDNY